MKENRVWRLYLGGKLLDELHGRAGAGEDGYFPEDWLASVVDAINPDRPGKPEREGLSAALLPDGSEAILRDLIEADPAAWLGEPHAARFGTKLGVLAKFLDSAERLPIQVHPDRETAKTLFRSDFGKTEAWYILAGREIGGEAPYILMGFQEEVTPARLRARFEAQDIAGMAALMHKIPVRPGEVYLIEGGMPHAIGPGCLLLEIQEPTDYTISLETHDSAGNEVPPRLVHQGVGFERMFDCFHYRTQSPSALLAAVSPAPRALAPGYEELISYDRTPCFSLRRRTVTSSAAVPASDTPYVLALTKGEGLLDGRPVRRGDCFFVPPGISYTLSGGLEALECWPPKSR
jgi:mannose-6-phosphate isomerase